MDRKGKIEEEKRGGREGWERSNPGGEPHCRADQSCEFCLWANLLLQF